MPFTPTTWVDGTTAITATELNRIEAGIEDAHAGDIDAPLYAWSAGGTLPAGWSVAHDGSGTYTVTHNLGTTAYHVVGCVVLSVQPNLVVNVLNKTSTTFEYRAQYTTATGGGGYIVGSYADFLLVVTA